MGDFLLYEGRRTVYITDRTAASDLRGTKKKHNSVGRHKNTDKKKEKQGYENPKYKSSG